MKKLLTVIVGWTALCAGIAQATIIDFTLGGKGGEGLLGTNENSATTNFGSGGILGGIQYDTDTGLLSIDVGWGSGNGFTDLSGDAVAAHIHGPADIFANAGVLYGLGFDGDAVNGGIEVLVAISASNQSALLNGLTYINVHTPSNGPGEIRGQLLAVPEPGVLGLLSLGLVSLLLRRRKV